MVIAVLLRSSVGTTKGFRGALALGDAAQAAPQLPRIRHRLLSHPAAVDRAAPEDEKTASAERLGGHAHRFSWICYAPAS